jgi:hypothetical protein
MLGAQNEAPARDARGLVSDQLVGRVPDDGEHILVVLAGGFAEIGVELARSEFGCREAERDVFLAGNLALAHHPAPISTPWVSTRKSGWVSAAFELFGTMSMSARIERVLIWPLKPPLVCLVTCPIAGIVTLVRQEWWVEPPRAFVVPAGWETPPFTRRKRGD